MAKRDPAQDRERAETYLGVGKGAGRGMRFSSVTVSDVEALAAEFAEEWTEALRWAADRIECSPAVNALPFADMLRRLADGEYVE